MEDCKEEESKKKKKPYVRPVTQVIRMEQQHILAGSDGNVTGDDFKSGDDDFWDDDDGSGSGAKEKPSRVGGTLPVTKGLWDD